MSNDKPKKVKQEKKPKNTEPTRRPNRKGLNTTNPGHFSKASIQEMRVMRAKVAKDMSGRNEVAAKSK